MLKRKLPIAIAGVLIICAALFGISQKASYTDITSAQDFYEDFSVAEMPQSMAKEDCERLKKNLPASPVILKVTPAEPAEYFFAGRQEKVRVLEVYRGDKIPVGGTIFLTTDRWKVYIEDKAMDMGFVNFMKDGSEYLVFLSDPIGVAQDGSTQVFRLRSGQYILAVFSISPCDNVISPTAGETTYVPYREVSGNEFFATDQEGLAFFLSLKEEMINRYVF